MYTKPDYSSCRATPRFYNLFAVNDVPSIQEIPKLDGLACSFLLGTTDMLTYGQIYDCLIKLLQIIHQVRAEGKILGTF